MLLGLLTHAFHGIDQQQAASARAAPRSCFQELFMPRGVDDDVPPLVPNKNVRAVSIVIPALALPERRRRGTHTRIPCPVGGRSPAPFPIYLQATNRYRHRAAHQRGFSMVDMPHDDDIQTFLRLTLIVLCHSVTRSTHLRLLNGHGYPCPRNSSVHACLTCILLTKHLHASPASCARPACSATLVARSSSMISSTVFAVDRIGVVQGAQPRLR